jgi:hypothetical protein
MIEMDGQITYTCVGHKQEGLLGYNLSTVEQSIQKSLASNQHDFPDFFHGFVIEFSQCDKPGE